MKILFTLFFLFSAISSFAQIIPGGAKMLPHHQEKPDKKDTTIESDTSKENQE